MIRTGMKPITNDELKSAFRTIVNYCGNHYRTGANCKRCEITEWCEDRSGFPKEWKKYIEETIDQKEKTK